MCVFSKLRPDKNVQATDDPDLEVQATFFHCSLDVYVRATVPWTSRSEGSCNRRTSCS